MGLFLKCKAKLFMLFKCMNYDRLSCLMCFEVPGEPLFVLCASSSFSDTQALAAMLGILMCHGSQKFQRTVKFLEYSWIGRLSVLCLYLLIHD